MQKRIPKPTIERVQRALENRPQQSVEGLTRLEAIRMLAPQIESAKSKGDSVEAIATLLSDSGIAMTAGTLRSYLSLVKTSDGKKTKRKPRRGSSGARSESNPAPAAPATNDAMAAPVRTQAQPAPVNKEKVKPVSIVGPAKAAERPPEDAASRRSSFVPREDTEDI